MRKAILCHSAKIRDNGLMPMVSNGLVQRTQLDKEIKRAVRKLGKEALHVTYSLGTESGGEPSIFFRIVLSDAASIEDRLAEVTGHIETIFFDEIRPLENWGLLPYFSFRSKSEQAKRHDPEWA